MTGAIGAAAPVSALTVADAKPMTGAIGAALTGEGRDCATIRCPDAHTPPRPPCPGAIATNALVSAAVSTRFVGMSGEMSGPWDGPAQPTASEPAESRVERLAARRESETVAPRRGDWIWALTRVALGFIFLWAFLDKLFGLNRSTPKDKAWIHGGSPTAGFLKSVDGPFKGMFNAMAGKAWADWLFMIGLAALGVALILGMGMIVCAVAGTILLVLMWMASLPIATNPFVDDHIIYALVIIGLAVSRVGERFGLGAWWARTALVRKLPFLR
jgi:thiosulfate dehydrogenase [quinone] large subunit